MRCGRDRSGVTSATTFLKFWRWKQFASWNVFWWCQLHVRTHWYKIFRSSILVSWLNDNLSKSKKCHVRNNGIAQIEKYGLAYDIKKSPTSGWALGDENVIGIRSFKSIFKSIIILRIHIQNDNKCNYGATNNWNQEAWNTPIFRMNRCSVGAFSISGGFFLFHLWTRSRKKWI